MAETFYWYDYETTGIDPAKDRVVQFAGIRTDSEFNIIAEPDEFFCQLHNDILPHPEACLVTGISPQRANQEGLLECDFIQRIHKEFSKPQTCVVGYNSIRFDDEFTRHLLYRNFYDPYAREWKSGNSRWDLIDVVRMTYALRPEGIHWPTRDGGLPTFRLEELTKANGISHEAAHDALSDVRATIALAKLIKEKQPKLYSWGLGLRNKKKASEQLDIVNKTALVHVSSKYPASQGCVTVVAPLIKHPVNNNGVIVVDLTVSPSSLIDLTADEIYERLYMATEDLPEGEQRVPLKTVHLNKSPMLAPIGTLSDNVRKKYSIDLRQCEENRQLIINANIAEKLNDVFLRNEFEAPVDPDLMLYSGGFFSHSDARQMSYIQQTPKDKLAGLDLPFEDERLHEMLFRYRARNYPETLSDDENASWLTHRLQYLGEGQDNGRLSIIQYFETLDELISQDHWTEQQQTLLEELVSYGEMIADSLDA